MLTIVPGSSALADEFYILVSSKSLNDQIVIEYRGAYNEKGKEMVAQKNDEAWDPNALVEYDDAGMVKKKRTIKKKYRLSDGWYAVQLGPLPGNDNINGRCGGAISVWVRVLKDGKQILYREMEGACHDMGPVTTKIVIRTRGRTPQITEVSNDSFYN